ncbi:hypothetical protein GOBAR_AA17767 [Gossypium barbadense]|uniref:Uncharacterized protein n=1 Tax=Gossypium barbadense TaxID=3634 RepID=A0A2P5XHS7_GOSBA|nr:hypothetical protein GOBAR_AA17767 [Gossypium barbadense]
MRRLPGNNIRERLDRGVLNSLEHLKHSMSDHYPIMLNTVGRTGGRTLARLFCFRFNADWYWRRTLMNKKNEELTPDFQKGGVVEAVKPMALLKALGNDGFSTLFYLKYWHVDRILTTSRSKFPYIPHLMPIFGISITRIFSTIVLHQPPALPRHSPSCLCLKGYIPLKNKLLLGIKGLNRAVAFAIS